MSDATVSGDGQTANSPAVRTSGLQTGAVTFLDVLGWKGIWLRHHPAEVVRTLEGLVQSAVDAGKTLRGTSLATKVRVISISDTIVLLTEGRPEETLPAHGMICSELVRKSIAQRIPLRGATSYGDYYASPNSILVGPAVDEAAGWHEAVDWIGVVLTPTASFLWTPGSPWIRYDRTPIKNAGMRALWCLNWAGATTIDELRAHFALAAPLDTTIAAKYLNTLDFFASRGD
jgi:hypothetical protein